MKVEARLCGKKWRVVNADTGVPILHATHGNAIDGGGHSDEAKARRQAGYIQAYFRNVERKLLNRK